MIFRNGTEIPLNNYNKRRYGSSPECLLAKNTLATMIGTWRPFSTEFD
jgi:hypothetical protein